MSLNILSDSDQARVLASEARRRHHDDQSKYSLCR
jgi:hypothetical protein